MPENALANLREAQSRGDYSALARIIVTLNLWTGNAPSAARQLQVLLKNYERLDNSDLEQLVDQFIECLTTGDTMNKSVFIVHGWDELLKYQTKNFLEGTLGLKGIVLHEQDGQGDVIINKFERYAKQCIAAVVLLSERDDATAQVFVSPNDAVRPRPNVLFELGYLFALLGRDKVLIFKKGNVEIHSDILGVEYIDVTHGVEAASEQIRRRLSWLSSRS
jgi:predicted nucleotide-binding protein